MSRTVTVTFGDSEYHMPATYKASKEIAEVVGDPIRMAVDSAAGKLEWTQEDVISIVYIGAKHAGCSLTRDAVGEFVVEQGVANVASVAGDYISSIVAGSPQKPVEGARKKAQRPSRG